MLSLILVILSTSYLILLFFIFKAKGKHKQKEELKQQNKYEYRTYAKEQLGCYTDKQHKIPTNKAISEKQIIAQQTTRLDKSNQSQFFPIYSKRNKKKTSVGLSSRHNGETYRIDYMDRSDEITSRIITINNIYRENNITYIKAFCHLRNEERTFRLERITGYITNTSTGEILDPDELNPLKIKTTIPVETAKSSIHLEISKHNGDWFIHHPNENVSTQIDRAKLSLTAYQRQIDAYRTAISKTIDSGADTLILYMHGKYRPPTSQESPGIIINQIDISTLDGIAKKKWLGSLSPK